MSYAKTRPTRVEINDAAHGAPLGEELLSLAARPPAGMVICKYGSRSVVGMHDLASVGRVVLKYYFPRSPLKRLTYGFRGSRARQSWRAGLELTRIGVATPEPLAFCEWTSAGGLLLDQSFLAVRHVAGVELGAFVERHAADGHALAAVAASLTEAFARLAEHRIAHGDLKASNIFVSDDHSVTFIDLDATEIGVSPGRWSSRRERDRKVFFDNWRDLPVAMQAFGGVFGGGA